MRVPPQVKFAPVGRCIYCGADPVGDEHIIPYSFGGNLVLPTASCRACADVTGAMEGHCCSTTFRALRVHHQIQTRRPNKRPKTLKVLDGKTPHGAAEREVPVDIAPGAVVFPVLPPPRILIGLPPEAPNELTGFAVWSTTDDAQQRQRALEADGQFVGALTFGQMRPDCFNRVLAKIARGYDVSQVGLGQSDDTLNPLILGTDPNFGYLVGGTQPFPVVVPDPSDSSGLHQIWPVAFRIDGEGYIAVQIRLFAHLKPPSPVYTVVMRQRKIPEGDFFFDVVTKNGAQGVTVDGRIMGSAGQPEPRAPAAALPSRQI